jgi:glycosyltransferase involved in cell wall biosynthesis
VKSDNQRLRILRLVERYDHGVAGGHMSYVAEAGRALAARGHEVHVLACMQGGPDEDRHDDGVHVHRRSGPQVALGSPHLPKANNRAYQITAHLVEHQRLGLSFDVIESPDFRACGLLLATTRAAPVVVRLHTPLIVEAEYDATLDPLDVRLSDMLECSLVRQATSVTAASSALRQQLRDRGWLDERPVPIIRNPVDVRRWVRAAPVNETKAVVAAVGRLEPRKSPEALVQAAALLKERVPGLQLLFLGRSNGSREGQPYGAWLRSFAQRLQVECQFIDEVPAANLPEIYGQARVVAVPSRQEGFSNVAVEAMAAGRPVVCTSATGVAELIGGSSAGAVVPVDEPQALAEAIAHYLLSSELAMRAGSAGRELVRGECDPARIAAQLEGCYREAITRWRSDG